MTGFYKRATLVLNGLSICYGATFWEQLTFNSQPLITFAKGSIANVSQGPNCTSVHKQLYDLSILVYGKLKVTTYPTTVLQVPNSEVRVTCKADPDTRDTRITWKKDNVNIESWSKSRPKNEAFVIQTNDTLYIGSLENRLTGKYECAAFSQSLGESAVATTTIKTKCKLSSSNFACNINRI